MKFECVEYWPVQLDVSPVDVKATLPMRLRDELLQKPPFDYGIHIDARKSEAIAELDRFFQIGPRKRFSKSIRLEIDTNEITEFSFFRIRPQYLDQGRNVFFDLARPTCKRDYCTIGAHLESPVRVKAKVLQRLELGEIGRIWQTGIELVVSRKIRSLFESEGITGLAYEPCLSQPPTADERTEDPIAFTATIVGRARETASDIVPQHFCRKHRVFVLAVQFDQRIRKRDLGSQDFQVIEKVDVKGQEWTYNKPLWIVSRRVVELLFKHKVRGLRTATLYLKEKFLPFPISDE